jgi:hypothetical protein
MDFDSDYPNPASLNREDDSRPYFFDQPIRDRLRDGLDSTNFAVVDQLLRTFRVPSSGIGLVALTNEISQGLSLLQAIAPTFPMPSWHQRIGQVISSLEALLATDAARDLSSLRGLPRQPLRNFLVPTGKRVSITDIRLLRAIRALLALEMLARTKELTFDLSEELARWLAGKFPPGLSPENLETEALLSLASNKNLHPEAQKVLNHIAYALRFELDDPFGGQPPKTLLLLGQHSADQNEDPDEEEDPADEVNSDPADLKDILDNLLAAEAIATRRKFSGVPTFDCMYPFELELIFPRILEKSDGIFSDEAFASELAVIIGVLPSQFHRVSLDGDASQGFSIRADGRCVQVNLDRIIGRKTGPEPKAEAVAARFFEIPFPVEVAQQIEERRHKHFGATTLNQLFDVSMEVLRKSTRAMLRSISVSSHRATLTRLAQTWGRYVLHVSRDEVYASAIACDFTIGTSANFNYVTIRAKKLKSILQACYRRIGYSGTLAEVDIQDVQSLRLPNAVQVTALLTHLASETAAAISTLPKRSSIEQLIATHFIVAINIFVMFKVLTGTRPLEEETTTRSQLDLFNALLGMVDKRTAPYHEQRIVHLSKFLVCWLEIYLAWLRLLAYRLSGVAPERAELIFSATESNVTGDRHPLFFIINQSLDTTAIGSQELTGILDQHGIFSNGGRHWVDDLLRMSDIDSATIMGQAGRANPGQELFGRWSAAIPAEALMGVASAVDNWLDRLELTPAPSLNPRQYRPSGIPPDTTPYIPKLLETDTGWSELKLLRSIAAPEACPFTRSTIALAAKFPEIFSEWRRQAPPPGWFGVALSLIFEDGVISEAELFGALAEIDGGAIYTSASRTFVDSRTQVLGIHRTDLSPVTLNLARRLSSASPAPITFEHFGENLTNEFQLGQPDAAVRLALECGEAYFVMHTPSALSAWARGLIFARTTRPDTVARHIFGVIELPKFDLRRRDRCIDAPGSVADALNRAKAARNKGSSHKAVLSSLREDLNQINDPDLMSTRTKIEIGYLGHLAAKLENLDTLLRYEGGARTFVRLAAEAIEQHGADETDWQEIVKQALEGRRDNSAPDITAINFVLDWLGIDLHVYQRSSAPPAARTYADLLSLREAQCAEHILMEQHRHPGDEFYLAAVAIQILRVHRIRWDALAHLRLCDLALDACPHLVINKESGANLKSDNAPTVHRLTDEQLIENLKLIANLRRMRFPGDPLVPIFGDNKNPRSIETASRVHKLLTDALRRATGSPVIRVHDCGHLVISERINRLLAPSGQLDLDTLSLRQGLYECAIQAGQSGPQVAVENYGHDFDRLRTAHFSMIKDKLAPPSDIFVAAVTGVSAATLRKRLSRNPEYAPDLAEGFSWSNFGTGATIIPLESLVASGKDHIPVTQDDQLHQTQTPLAVYVGLRLLGDSGEAARLVSGLSEDRARPLETGLASATQGLGAPLQARGDINRETFLDAILNNNLAVAMTVVHPDRHLIARIERSLQTVGNEWIISDPLDALGLAPWISVWAANGISTELLIRPSKRSLIDSDLLAKANRSGFARARSLAPRHFPRGMGAILRFFPTPESARPLGKARTSPQATFLLGACALSIHWQLTGV